MSDPDHMYRLASTFAFGHWTFYVTDRDTFPLNDSPILASPDSMMVALSPRLLVDIDRSRPQPEDQWEIRHGISQDKLADFRVRTIGNTYREVIFSDSDVFAHMAANRRIPRTTRVT